MARIEPARSFSYSILSLLAALVVVASASQTPACSVFFQGSKTCEPFVPKSFFPAGITRHEQEKLKARSTDLALLAEVVKSISVLQNEYYTAWLGTWPESIDWTGAVIGTQVSATSTTLSEALMLMSGGVGGVEDWKLKENLIETYFSHIAAYYFGENALAIRNEAYDDILWVVLGWLEAVKFIKTHTKLHYKLQTRITEQLAEDDGGLGAILGNQTWHGNLWTSGFSHRARVFWDLATRGWDTELCGGGMTWNPRLLPYKNAITNELFIAASISMYLYFPGDANASPFSNKLDTLNPNDPGIHFYVGPRDPIFLQAAVDGYKWLVASNMTDSQGLFVDGFHISGYRDPNVNNTVCDERNDMVFTYNQGVLLTGQRGLWEATGAASYLSDGHELIQNVINATGYDLVKDQPLEDSSMLASDEVPQWYGLGRAGVMEDQCDASGTCSQDGQTFKGIFFHHLAAFCAPVALPDSQVWTNVDLEAFAQIKTSHEGACSSYSGWLKQNAEAAIGTRDKDGKFGSWWTAGLLTNFTAAWPSVHGDGIDRNPKVAGIDYRNYGIPNDEDWEFSLDLATSPEAKVPVDVPPSGSDRTQQSIRGRTKQVPMGELRRRQAARKDPNMRGRGRTVETQASGLALMRAYWSIAKAP